MSVISAISQLTATEIPFTEALVWRFQRTMVVLWPGPATHAIAVGLEQALTLHCHYATQINISLGAPVRMRTRASGPYIERQSFVVGPNIPHQVEATSESSFILWSEAPALADLASRLRAASTSDLPALPEELLNALLPILIAFMGQVAEADGQAGRALLARVLTTLIGANWDARDADAGADDARIATARSLVTPRFLAEQSEPIATLATRVCLSPSRFRHLFRNEMGVSVQSYLRWRRLMAAVRASVRGMSLTEAAHTAGFADSAHLTRVFRAAFGLAPSHALKPSHFIQVATVAQR